MAGIQPFAGQQTKATTATLPVAGCQPTEDVALLKNGPRRGVIISTSSEFRLHFVAPAATSATRARTRPPTLRRGRRLRRAGQPRLWGRRPNCPRTAGLWPRPRCAGPRGCAGAGGRGRQAGGRGCCDRASRPGCAAGAGRRRPPRLGLTKRKQASSSVRSPSTRARLRARVGRARDPEGARRGRGTSCLGPRPGPIPECFRSLRSQRGASAPTRPRTHPPPAALTPSGCGSRRPPAAFASPAGMKPLSHQSLRVLVRPWPWPLPSLVWPQRQSHPV